MKNPIVFLLLLFPFFAVAQDGGRDEIKIKTSYLNIDSLQEIIPVPARIAVFDINNNIGYVAKDSIGGAGGGGTPTFSGVSAWKTSTFSYGDITFDQEEWDTDNYHNVSTNSNQFIAPSDGYYLVNIRLQLDDNSYGTLKKTMWVYKNTSVMNYVKFQVDYYGQMASLVFTKIVYLTTGQYIKAMIYNDSDSGRVEGGQQWSYFQMIKIGE